MRVSVEEIMAMRARRKEINNTPLEDIEWTQNGEVITDITPEEIEEWRFTGLSHADFIVNRIEPFVSYMVITPPPEFLEMLVKDEKRLLVEEMDRNGFALTEEGKKHFADNQGWMGLPPFVDTPGGRTATIGNQGKFPDGSWKPSI